MNLTKQNTRRNYNLLIYWLKDYIFYCQFVFWFKFYKIEIYFTLLPLFKAKKYPTFVACNSSLTKKNFFLDFYHPYRQFTHYSIFLRLTLQQNIFIFHVDPCLIMFKIFISKGTFNLVVISESWPVNVGYPSVEPQGDSTCSMSRLPRLRFILGTQHLILS